MLVRGTRGIQVAVVGLREAMAPDGRPLLEHQAELLLLLLLLLMSSCSILVPSPLTLAAIPIPL